MAHYESTHQDLRCLQIQLFSSLVLKELTTKKQTTKFSSANFQRMLSPSYIILRIQRLKGNQCRSSARANSVDLDEVAHYEPPHENLRCLQI